MSNDKIERFNINQMTKRAIQEMQGIAAAIICDGPINDSEIQLIKDWLNRNVLVLQAWPLSELATMLRDILKDGVITPDERKKLGEFLLEISVTTDKTASHSQPLFPALS